MCYTAGMTKLLEDVVRKVAELPDARQDDAAQVLLAMLENDTTNYRLSPAQVAEVELAQQDVRAGGIATDAQMRELWAGFGA